MNSRCFIKSFPFVGLIFLFLSSIIIAESKKEPIKRWKEADFEIETKGYSTYKVGQYGYMFSERKNCIVKIAPEIEGLTGIKLLKSDSLGKSQLRVKFKEPVKVLFGVFQNEGKEYFKPDNQFKLILDSGASVTGLPAVRIYARSFSKGSHFITNGMSGLFMINGIVKENQVLKYRNAALPDGRRWDPFIVEGFYNEKPLFEIVGGEDAPILDAEMAGAEEIQGGFEGGACVKVGDTYHMFPTERAGQKGVEAYFDRVKTRIGHWTSKDAIHWKRESTIYQASGNYAVTDDDNPLNDRRGAIWSYMPVFNKEKNKWYGYYLTYTVHKEIQPNHSFGRIWRTESQTDGINGIGGPYGEGQLIMEPGFDSQLWEGRQGVASFFPYPVGDHWLGFYSGAYPFLKREDYPTKSGKGWFVGLAKAESLEGPWTRLDTTINPIKTIHPWFVENPIVYQMPNGLYLAIFDGGPEGWGHHLPNMIGYTLSKDGYHWSEAHYLPIHTKVKKWWDIMRTPMCLIPEGNDLYTIVYAAIDLKKRFHPLGMVKVKLNEDVLEEIRLKNQL